MKPNVKSLSFDVAVLTVTQIFSQVVSFAFRVALARAVGAEGMGLYQLIMPAYAVVMSITAYGLTVAVSRQSSSYSAVGNHAAVRQIVRQALFVFLILFGLVTLLVVPFSDWISVSLLSDARTRMGLLLLLPCIFFTGFENIFKNYFYGVQEVRPPAATEIVEQLLRAGCVLTLLAVLRPSYLEWTIGVIVIGMVVCEVVSSAMLAMFYSGHIRKRPDTGYRLSERKLLGEMFNIAVPVSGATLAANLLASVNTIIIPGRLMLSGLGQSQSLSAYGVAFGMTLPLTTLPSVFVIPLSLTMMPRIAQSAALNNRAALKKQINKALRLTALLVIPSCLLLVPFGKPIMSLLFKERNPGQFVEILAVAEIFSCFQYILNSLLNGIGKQRRAAFNVLLSDAIQLGLTWYLVAIPGIRLWGYVASYLVTTALCALLNFLDIDKVNSE